MTTYEDDFNDEKRQTYKEIRIDAMESAYGSCRVKLMV
jgi:hypothetical protein